ncbi:MAG: class I SAM-dependent methyltransferase [Rhabdochlamydiaceae bacterium]
MKQEILFDFKALTLEERVDHWNETFSEIPKTCYDKGWIYGVWYCGTSFKKATYYGQYPPNFLKKVKALFPDKKDVLHVCSGTVKEDITIDLKRELSPTICTDAQNLPLRENSFDLVIHDPPYSKKDADVYYGVPYVSVPKVMKQTLRILRVGGFFCVLDVRYPSYHRKEGWRLIGLIAIVTGFSKVTRMLSIFQKVKQI